MVEFTFTLEYRLPPATHDIDLIEQCLADAGCDDALLGSGQPGHLSLVFYRESESAASALVSALEHVQSAVPGAELVEVNLDLAG
ncbi:hypothetical protein ACI703_11500 [Isoptericola jiangsuensis]|uniref:hypothetical protein n=1 Tax=Isoptericola jiangsuensis TaxID=548579 RepID=UPI00386722F0